jgi:hypothetical protein
MKKDFDPAIGKATRWQKGQPSPNPGGRPRRTKLTDAFRDILAEPFPRDKQGRTHAEMIARRVANETARGNLRALTEMADRTEGKVRTENQLPGMDDQGLPSLDIPDSGSARENLRVLTERLRLRIELRKSRVLAQTSQCGG